MCETKRSMSGALGPHTGEPQFGFVRWNIGEHTMPRLVVAKKCAGNFGKTILGGVIDAALFAQRDVVRCGVDDQHGG